MRWGDDDGHKGLFYLKGGREGVGDHRVDLKGAKRCKEDEEIKGERKEKNARMSGETSDRVTEHTFSLLR